MTGRVFGWLICGAVAWAQLPPPQAPRSRSELHETGGKRRPTEREPAEIARLDVVVTDRQGQPVRGLTAADFTLEADGKARKIESCEPRIGEPLRLAVLLDDLSLNAARIDAARRSLRKFVNELKPGDEAAILRSSAGTGALDRFTSDRAELESALNRATYNPISDGAPPEAFAAGTIDAARGILEGMEEMPGRKALLVISDRLRDPARGAQASWPARLAQLAHRASAVLYAVDMEKGAEGAVRLEQGLTEAARETGGLVFDGGDVSGALARIAADQSAYYLLTWAAEGLSFDYIAWAPRVSRVAVKPARPDTAARARNGVLGSAFDGEDGDRDASRDFAQDLSADLNAGGIGVRLTAVVMSGAAWQVNGILHIDGAAITFVKGLDGAYRTSLDVGLALYGDGGALVKDGARNVTMKLTEKELQEVRRYGVDAPVTLPLASPGWRQLRALAEDSATGRMGSARQVLTNDWGPGKLSISSIIMQGETEKSADGSETIKDPDENSTVRKFRVGHKFSYTYYIFNLAADAEKRSSIDVRARLWRDGSLIVNGDPMPLQFSPAENPGRRTASGAITLREDSVPGHYVLGLAVTDKLNRRTATQFIDFDVRP